MGAKIALIVTLPVVAAMAFFSWHHYTQERDMIFRSAQTQLLLTGEGLKESIETLRKKNDPAGIQSIIDQRARGADVDLIMLFNTQGKVTASNKKIWINKDLREVEPQEITENDVKAIQNAFAGGYSLYYDPLDSQYCLAMPASIGGKGPGVLHISLDTKSVHGEIKKGATENLVIAVIVSAVIGISIYFLLHALFTNRVKAVSLAAVKLATGDLAARAAVGGTDEIGELAASFNALAEGIAVWRNNLEEIAASRLKELKALFDVVDTISRSLELGKVLPVVLGRTLDNLGADKGAVVLLGQDGTTLLLGAHRGLSEEGLCQIIEGGQGCTGDVILRNDPIRVEGYAGEADAFVPGLEQDNIRSALVAPVSLRGAVLGAFAVYSEKKNRFSDGDEALLTAIGNQVGVAVENARLYEKTLELAQVDGLTGVANRRHLMERLKQEIDRAERYQTSLSVIMLDLDKFKSFNDAYGHVKGDELLKSFSTMVKSAIRSTDIAGRYGGEEFCVILPNTSVKGAAVIAERIRKAMEELKISAADGQPPVGRTLSIGIAEFSAGETVEKLLSAADAALYRAKAGGRNRAEWR